MTDHKTNESDTPFSTLSQLGWDDYFQGQLTDPSEGIPARVTGVRKNHFIVNTGDAEFQAVPAGKLRHDRGTPFPVIGDWVLVQQTLITRVLARKNALARGASGTHNTRDSGPRKKQVIAANLDTVFIVCGLDRDFNLRRIERYLTLVYNCGLNPAIILTKADLHPDPESSLAEVETVAFGVPAFLVSATDPACLDPLSSYLSPGRTTTMIGSSGAGKSTLVNRLLGKEIQETASVSDAVGKGRHTTTTRDLFLMPQGGMIIDNPGIREISFWETDSDADSVFPEIEAFALECRFSDCSHTCEPGCRVLAAAEQGELPMERLDNYMKMRKELDYVSQRAQKSADRLEKERWKKVAMKIKAMNKKQ